MTTPLHRAAALAVGGAYAAWCLSYRVSPMADAVISVTTTDGWRLALSRYGRAPTRRHPVLLVPGLSANRVGFDLDPKRSFARFLAAQGYDVWCLELRGHGLSETPSLGGRRYGWCFDDYLRFDLPAALERILSDTGRDAVHWIGHSMGGVLLYAHLASGGGAVRSGTAIASSLDYSGTPSDFQNMRTSLLGLTRLLPAVPFGPLALGTAPLAGRVKNRLEEFNVWLPNLEPHLARRLNASTFHLVSSPVLVQLATAMEPGGLRSQEGVRYTEGLGDAHTPVLALAADRDRQCASAAAEATLEALAARERRLVVFGKSQGQVEHYGHFDLLVGRRVRTEVWPVVAQWLEERD